MTNLSWMIYGADVVDSLKTAMILAFSMGLVVGAICLLVAAINSEYDGAVTKAAVKSARICIVSGLIGGFFSCFLPEKDTMYAIAAVEAGNELAHTQTATKAVTAINTWLDNQIKAMKKEAKE